MEVVFRVRPGNQPRLHYAGSVYGANCANAVEPGANLLLQ